MTAPASLLTNYYGDLLLAQLAAGGGYLALFEDDPGVAGDLTHEIAGAIRQPITFDSPSIKSLVNNNLCTFNHLPLSTVNWFAICDTLSAGHVLVRIPLGDNALDVLAMGVVYVRPGDLGFTI